MKNTTESNITLTNPTDDELDAAVAEHVAGWKRITSKSENDPCWETRCETGHGYAFRPMRYSRSADAVMPLLEKFGCKGTSNRAGGTCAATVFVNSQVTDGEECIAQSDDRRSRNPFAHAAAVALLRAKGITVNFT